MDEKKSLEKQRGELSTDGSKLGDTTLDHRSKPENFKTIDKAVFFF